MHARPWILSPEIEIAISHTRFNRTEGMVAFWKTINPPDLKNPLAGVEYSNDSFPAATVAFRQAVATSNPAAVAQFFHHTCKAVLEGLLAGGTGILGDVSN